MFGLVSSSSATDQETKKLITFDGQDKQQSLSSESMKSTFKQFLSKLGVSTKDKIECNVCWE